MVNGERIVQDNVEVKDVDRVIEQIESGKIRMNSAPKKKAPRKNEVVDGIEVVDTVTLVEEPVVLEITSSPMEDSVKEGGRRRGKNNELRQRALDLISRLKSQEKTQKEILKKMIEELDITHANAWYYLNKVYRD